jgi:hypothetical protein
MTSHISIIWILLILCTFAYADDEFDDSDYDDIDFDFSIHQKSTIDDFPMQEVGQEELSNTAVAGALSTRAALQSKKPIYEEKEEENEKLLNKDVTKESEEDDLTEIDNLRQFSQSQISAPQFEQPTYNTPNGRIYTEHNTHTVERY